MLNILAINLVKMLYNILLRQMVHFALKNSLQKYLEGSKISHNFALAFENETKVIHESEEH